MSRLPCFLDKRLTDGGEVFSLTRRPPFTPRNCFMLNQLKIKRDVSTFDIFPCFLPFSNRLLHAIELYVEADV
jgi:hypothetical protein